MVDNTMRNKAEAVGVGSLLFSFFSSLILSNTFLPVASSFLCATAWTYFVSVYRFTDIYPKNLKLLSAPFKSLFNLTTDLLLGKNQIKAKVAAEKLCGYIFLLTGFYLANCILNKASIVGPSFLYLFAFVPPIIYVCRLKTKSRLSKVILFFEFYGFNYSKFLLKFRRSFCLRHRHLLYTIPIQKGQKESSKVFVDHCCSREPRLSTRNEKKQGCKKSDDPDPEGPLDSSNWNSDLVVEFDKCASLDKNEAHHE